VTLPTQGPRVLHVAHHALPHLGGLETVVAAETRGLVARGWEVAVVSSATSTVAGSRRTEGVREVRVRAWNGMETRFGAPFPVFSPWLLLVLWHEVRRADLVHVHDPLYLTSWVAAFWCRVTGTPYVVHRHVGFVHHSSRVVRAVQTGVLRTLGRWVLSGAAAIAAIDEPIADHTRQTLSETAPVHVLGNGVDVDRFAPLGRDEKTARRRDLGLPSDMPLVLFVGRLVPKKGFPWVAASAGDNYRVVFAGGDRPPGVDDERLAFLGALPPDAMPAVYASVDAFVVASVGECPLTVLEAMSSGLPVLLNEDPALHSPWTSGPGVRFVDMASGQLPAAITDLLADPEELEAMGRAARGHVLRGFSWDSHLDRLEDLYRQVLREDT
jgi:glycosyltransferase involved in cell wall biosynthesis